MSTLNKLVAEIHKNAVDHGWWEGVKRSLAKLVALFHSELSEALEEYRRGNDFEYEVNGKPEGIAVELADYLIRIFDYCGAYKIDVDALVERYKDSDIAYYATFEEFIAECHKDTSDLYRASRDYSTDSMFFEYALTKCILRVGKWFEQNGLDMIGVIERKHAYNKKRSYRHGGKVC